MTRLLVTLAFPPHVGGMQRHLYQWVSRARAEYLVAAPSWPGAAAWDAQQPFPIYRWSGGPGGWPGWRRVRQTAGALRALQWARARGPLEMLELGQVLPFGLVALWAQARWGIPYRVWAFGDDVLKPARRPVVRALTRMILTRASRVYAISHYTGELLRTRFRVSAQVVHPRPAAHFRPGDARAARARLGLPQDALILLTVARLEPRKGVDRVLRVLPALVRRFPHLLYAVVGEGSARARWQALAHRLGVAHRVLWAGQVDDATLVSWYRAADLFVLIPTPGPGEVEGFGLVYVEAAACGLPSVAGDNGGVREAVLHGKTGWLVPPDDPEQLEAALTLLLGDDALRGRLRRWMLGH